MKQKILFIVHNIHGSSARSIRCSKIIKRLCDEYEIHVLNLARYQPSNNRHEFIHNLHNLNYNRLTKTINPENKYRASNERTGVKKFKYFFKKILVKHTVKKIFFPDRQVLGYPSLNERLKRLTLKHNYKFIISFVGVLSFLLLGKTIKNLNIRYIVDLGDPLTYNSANQKGCIGNFLINKYEEKMFKYIDILIVTNNFTMKYYINKYGSIFSNKNVFVIPQGTDILVKHRKIKKNNQNNFGLIYAGQFYEKLRDPNSLFEAVKSLMHLNINLDIYGGISLKHFSDDILNNETNIKYNGKISHDNLIKEYEISDVLVFIDNAYGIQQSGKIFELMAMKKPILFIYSNERSESFDITMGYDAIEYSINDVNSIKKAINKLKANYHNYKFNYDYTAITWDNRAEKYKNILYGG